jgi:hypothetical protein
VSPHEYYFFFLRKDVFHAIWYGGLLAQQLAIDIAMQIRKHTMEFYKSEQQLSNTKAQRQAFLRDKIVNFSLNSISSYRRSSTIGFTSFYGTRRNDPRRNDGDFVI